MKRKYLCCILSILWCITLNAQTIIGNMLNSEQERARISLIDEFMKRFNGIEDRPDITPNTKDYDEKRYLVLFNGKMFKSFNDSTFIAAKEFVNKVRQDSVTLHFSDTTWFAKATCHGTLRNKEVSFVLYLTVEARAADMFKWVINRAEGKIFELTPSVASNKVMIGPDSHEIKFMNLQHITSGKDDYISYYISKNHIIDPTTTFLTLVYNGLLNIDYVEDLEFFFYQVPNYVFSIKEFNRNDSKNDGWLINSFRKIPEQEKKEYLISLYK